MAEVAENSAMPESIDADTCEADADSIGSGPGNDSISSSQDNQDINGTLDSIPVDDHCPSEICATVSIATVDASTTESGPTTMTSVFVSPETRGEINRPAGWLTALSEPAVLQTQTPSTLSSDFDISVQLAPPQQISLTSPFPSLVESLRMTAITAVKRTRQTLSEKLGHGSKTVDVDLEARIEALREAQRRYGAVLQLTRTFTGHFGALVVSQQALGGEFADLAQKMPELHDEYMYNAETQRAIHRNGETLLSALNFFISTLNTLCYKTIDDTLLTVKQYEEARVEYDAYRRDVESGQPSQEAQQRFEQQKQKFDRLRQVLDVKLKLLHENKVKVMHQQLLLFHNAVAAYFSGNQAALDETIRQFSIKLKSPNSTSPSWLESQP